MYPKKTSSLWVFFEKTINGLLKKQGWKFNASYRFLLKHRPKTGVINLQIYEGAKKIIDSGDVIDHALSGGRVGVFTCSQV